jgi:hypothetical protein
MNKNHARHPMQPVYRDQDGRVRFHKNGIIRRLVDTKVISLNMISQWHGTYPGISQDDVDQFWQLLGYSVGGYSELEFISDEAVKTAESVAAAMEKECP